MADIFTILNELNTSFQGPNKTIFNMLDKIAAFKLKLDVRIRRAGRGEIEIFEELHQFVTARWKNVNAGVIIEHLTNLRQRFEDYFPPGDNIR